MESLCYELEIRYILFVLLKFKSCKKNTLQIAMHVLANIES